ncbi:MAG: hypothetical protein EU529_03220 [Promethearchaeota archaeon]|nr:MAG: hypothetical protein EU529_03220 [Candidatus Lokiarchaeota archaeon]
MKNLKNFRIVNDTEKKIIINSLSKISTNILQILGKVEFKLFILLKDLSSKNKFPSIFLVPNNLREFLDTIEFNRNVDSAGLYFGFIKRNQFFLSLEGAEFLNNLNCFSEKDQIQVNDDGEKAILYGNKILKKMIIKISSNLGKKEFLLVFNRLNELIAIARSQIDYKTSQNLNITDLIALNLNDKGYYLRREQ